MVTLVRHLLLVLYRPCQPHKSYAYRLLGGYGLYADVASNWILANRRLLFNHTVFTLTRV